MYKITILLAIVVVVRVSEQKTKRQKDLSCCGRAHYNVTLAAYYPDFSSDFESDYLDSRGKKLRTLQDYVDDRAEFVTVAMDSSLKLKYGTELCVPELNEHYGQLVTLQVRDHGYDLKGTGYGRLDVCVRSEADSYDRAVNRRVTIYTLS